MKKRIQKISDRIAVKASLIAVCAFYVSCGGGANVKSDVKQQVSDTIETTIVISPDAPFDVNDPSNLAEAANFAWNEFIALTWPAQAQGPTNFPRGQAYTAGKYGDKGPTGQVVWETFRHRVEAFPGEGNPNGYDPSKPDYGFGSRPKYIYGSGPIPPLNPKSDTSAIPPFNNLDEVTQISLNSMYAGTGPGGNGGSAAVRSQKILFEAKVNGIYYQYIAKNRYFESDSPRVELVKRNSKGYLVTGDTRNFPPPYTNLPASNPQAKQNGSIEIKASFRRLNPKTDDTSKFYKAVVRYYSGDGNTTKVNGYVNSNDPGVNEIWGLVSLHIIQKTPNAPAFIYATFSQYNNILDSNGKSVEDVDGNTYPQYLSEEPFSPSIKIINSSVSMPKSPQIVYTTSTKAYKNNSQLYFQNVVHKEAIVKGSATSTDTFRGPVAINRRLYPIPPVIVNANKMAHAMIAKANPKAVWLNYKLVNVQAKPLDYRRDSAQIDGNGSLAPTYFLANEVVETNPSLQHFSGALDTARGSISNYAVNPYADSGRGHLEYDYNVFIRQHGSFQEFNMGGCMGCHGSQGQKRGGDFSVLLFQGRIPFPDVIEDNTMNPFVSLMLSKKYKFITGKTHK